MKFGLIVLGLMICNAHAFAAGGLRCAAEEAGLGIRYITDIEWSAPGQASIALSVSSDGQEISLCRSASPFGVSQEAAGLKLAGRLICEGETAPRDYVLLFDQAKMKAKDDLRELRCVAR